MEEKYISNINELITSAASDETDRQNYTNNNTNIDDKVTYLLEEVKENKDELTRVNNLVTKYNNDKTTTETNLNKTIYELIQTSDSIIKELNSINRLEFPQKDIPISVAPPANPVSKPPVKDQLELTTHPPLSSESLATTQTSESPLSSVNTTGGKQKKRNKTPKSKKRNKKTRSKKNKRTRKHRN